MPKHNQYFSIYCKSATTISTYTHMKFYYLHAHQSVTAVQPSISVLIIEQTFHLTR